MKQFHDLTFSVFAVREFQVRNAQPVYKVVQWVLVR